MWSIPVLHWWNKEHKEKVHTADLGFPVPERHLSPGKRQVGPVGADNVSERLQGQALNQAGKEDPSQGK